MKIGMLTGGGDCPGLNAVIRGAVRKGVSTYGHDFIGFRDGWRGPLENETMQLGIPEHKNVPSITFAKVFNHLPNGFGGVVPVADALQYSDSFFQNLWAFCHSRAVPGRYAFW